MVTGKLVKHAVIEYFPAFLVLVFLLVILAMLGTSAWSAQQPDASTEPEGSPRDQPALLQPWI